MMSRASSLKLPTENRNKKIISAQDFTLTLLVLGCGVLLFAVVTMAVPQDVGLRLIADDGLVQLATFAILIVAVFLAAFLAIRLPGERIFMGLTAYVLVFYAAREADLHKAEWMPEHFTSARFYLSAEVPLIEKLTCGPIMLSLIIAAVLLVVLAMPKIVPAFRAKSPWILFSTMWLCVFTGSQISDQSSWNFLFVGQAFEEIAEFVAAGFVVLTLIRYPSHQRLSSAVTKQLTLCESEIKKVA